MKIHSNFDNVFNRNVIAGVLRILNNLKFSEIVDNETFNEINVPFFFASYTDERFMQDYFIHFNDCLHPKLADGNYDVIPRGALIFNSKSIKSDEKTQHYSIGKYYKKNKNGDLIAYKSFVALIPVKFNFSLEILCDTFLNASKIDQTILETFFKIKVFYIIYKGINIPCYLGFPNEMEREDVMEYSYPESNQIKLKLNLECDTYQPIFDVKNEIESSKVIMNFIDNYYSEIPINQNNSSRIEIKNLQNGDTLFNGRKFKVFFDALNVNSHLKYNLIVNSQVFEGNIGNPYQYSFDLEVPKIEDFDNSYNKTWNLIITTNTNPSQNADVYPFFNNFGQLSQIYILNSGFGYGTNTQIQIVKTTTPFTSPVLITSVLGSEIVDIHIQNGGSGFDPSPSYSAQLNILDSNSQILKTLNLTII